MIPLKSRITVEVLNYYFINSEARHYVNELARILDLDPKNLYRKLKELEKEGILKSEFAGKQRYFSFNKNSKIAKIYKQLFLQTIGLEDQLRKAIGKIRGVEHAYIYGSYAKHSMSASSDIDLLVIGNHSTLDLQKGLNLIQRRIGREINVTNISSRELSIKIKKKNPFIRHIFSDKRIKLL